MKNFIEKEVFLGSQDELLQLIVANSNDKKRQAYFAINSDCMLNYWKDEEYRRIINQKESLVYVDGMGVIYAQKILKIPVAKERIATTDLFPALFKKLNTEKSDLKVFLLGGEQGTAAKVQQNFLEQYPHVTIAGTHHGYFDHLESFNVINLINTLNVDILFVGLGNPKQEKWVQQYADFLEATTLITCGGLYDYYSYNVKRAPVLMQKTGFEWLFRLVQEPRRLYRRYIFGNFKYILKVLQLKFA
ncbi:WecB/TagA/CpsF family glycosyltransferase [Ureibacillus chungkukjangi]|uniref:WecB/TagA/CpsF family glycosyltransferase n=1 Tax=Ureibacillus chungkukjangi TaxID=1202712 RepID=UPI00384D88B5